MALNNPIDSNTKPRAMVSSLRRAEHESSVELIIRDEKGNILVSQTPPDGLGTQSLYEIEEAIENWIQQVLPKIEVDLLRNA